MTHTPPEADLSPEGLRAHKIKAHQLSADVLRARLNYDPSTGIFTRIAAAGRHLAGSECGRVGAHGYVLISVFNNKQQASRLAWLYMTGEWPPQGHYIDHINGVTTDNRWSNLRLANPTESQANTKLRKNNTSGMRGVSQDRRTGKWNAQIHFRGKHIWIGSFPTPDEAKAAYDNRAEELFGSFVRAVA